MNQANLLALKGESFKKEALFSAISHLIFNADLTVNIFTDDMPWFQKKMTLIKGHNERLFIKPCPAEISITNPNSLLFKVDFIVSQYNPEEKFIFCDTDTFSLSKWDVNVFEPGTLYFSRLEYDIKRKNPEKIIVPFLKNNFSEYKGRYLMYNTGFIGIPSENSDTLKHGREIAKALYEAFPEPHFAHFDQLFAIPFYNKYAVSESVSFLCHYWFLNKTEIHQQIDALNFDINAIQEWLQTTGKILHEKELKAEDACFNPPLSKRLIHQWNMTKRFLYKSRIFPR